MPESYQDAAQLQSLIRCILREERFGILDPSVDASEPSFSIELKKRLNQSQKWFSPQTPSNAISIHLDDWNDCKILRLSQKLDHLPKDRPILLQSTNLRKALSAAFYLSDQDFNNLTLQIHA